jgi:hypothetical protein
MWSLKVRRVHNLMTCNDHLNSDHQVLNGDSTRQMEMSGPLKVKKILSIFNFHSSGITATQASAGTLGLNLVQRHFTCTDTMTIGHKFLLCYIAHQNLFILSRNVLGGLDSTMRKIPPLSAGIVAQIRLVNTPSILCSVVLMEFLETPAKNSL